MNTYPQKEEDKKHDNQHLQKCICQKKVWILKPPFLPGATGKPNYMLIETTDSEGSGGGEDFSLALSACPKERPKGPGVTNKTPCKQKDLICKYDHIITSCPQIPFKCTWQGGSRDLNWYYENKEGNKARFPCD